MSERNEHDGFLTPQVQAVLQRERQRRMAEYEQEAAATRAREACYRFDICPHCGSKTTEHKARPGWGALIGIVRDRRQTVCPSHGVIREAAFMSEYGRYNTTKEWGAGK